MPQEGRGFAAGIIALLGLVGIGGGVAAAAKVGTLGAKGATFATRSVRVAESFAFSAAGRSEDVFRQTAVIRSTAAVRADDMLVESSASKAGRIHSEKAASESVEVLDDTAVESRALRILRDLGLEPEKLPEDLARQIVEQCLSGCTPPLPDSYDDESSAELRRLLDQVETIRASQIVAAQDQTRTLAEIRAAAVSTAAIFPQEGMFGLVNNFDRCYEERIRSPAYCVHLDIGARHIDQTFSELMQVSTLKFFGEEEFGKRTERALNRAGLTPAQATDFVREMTPSVVHEVDAAMLGNLRDRRQ